MKNNEAMTKVSKDGSRSAGKGPRRWLAGAIVAVLVVLGVAAGTAYAVGTGFWAPPGAAAKYDFASYVGEDEVSEYIATYRQQMGLAEVTEEEWATFLASNELTPERLRESTLYNLIADRLVEKRAAEAGLTVSEEEIDSSLETLKGMLAFDDDVAWQETLASFGQTEEGLRKVYRLEGLRQKLCAEQVPQPEPTSDQVRSALSAYVAQEQEAGRDAVVKHSYCLRMAKSSAEGSLEERQAAQQVRDEFARSDKTVEGFSTLQEVHGASSDGDGDYGWDVDEGTYTADYQSALADMKAGDVSQLLADDESYYFIWVDQVCDTAAATREGGAGIEGLPDSLAQYFEDRVAAALWQTASDAYVEQLVADAQVVYFPFPEDAPYNVDMALVQKESEALDGADAHATAESQEGVS